MNVYCAPDPKACFLLVNALQCHPRDVQLQTPSPPRVSPLDGVSSSHQHTLVHKAENKKARPGKQIYVSRAQQVCLCSVADRETKLESCWQKHTWGCGSITLGPRATALAHSSIWMPRFKPCVTGCSARDHCCPPFPACFPPFLAAQKEPKMSFVQPPKSPMGLNLSTLRFTAGKRFPLLVHVPLTQHMTDISTSRV